MQLQTSDASSLLGTSVALAKWLTLCAYVSQLETGAPMADVTERVRTLGAEHLGVPAGIITAEASFVELGADSLDSVELVLSFEEEFGCEIPDDLAAKVATVKQAIEFIEAQLGGQR